MLAGWFLSADRRRRRRRRRRRKTTSLGLLALTRTLTPAHSIVDYFYTPIQADLAHSHGNLPVHSCSDRRRRRRRRRKKKDSIGSLHGSRAAAAAAASTYTCTQLDRSAQSQSSLGEKGKRRRKGGGGGGGGSCKAVKTTSPPPPHKPTIATRTRGQAYRPSADVR